MSDADVFRQLAENMSPFVGGDDTYKVNRLIRTLRDTCRALAARFEREDAERDKTSAEPTAPIVSGSCGANTSPPADAAEEPGISSAAHVVAKERDGDDGSKPRKVDQTVPSGAPERFRVQPVGTITEQWSDSLRVVTGDLSQSVEVVRADVYEREVESLRSLNRKSHESTHLLLNEAWAKADAAVERANEAEAERDDWRMKARACSDEVVNINKLAETLRTTARRDGYRRGVEEAAKSALEFAMGQYAAASTSRDGGTLQARALGAEVASRSISALLDKEPAEP